jgi:hypothetical protein
MPTISTQLKQEVEAWVSEFRHGTLPKLKARRLSPRFVAWYLESLRYLLSHTEPNLELAAHRSLEGGRDDLAAYFRRKACEEHGHEAWAENDLSNFPTSLRGMAPAPAIVELAELQRALIAEHPMCYAVYALWVEYLTVLLGDEWLAMFSDSGFPPTGLSAVANHLEADRDHVAFAFGQLDALWRDEPSITTLRSVVQRGGRLFVRFCDELHRECNLVGDPRASCAS